MENKLTKEEKEALRQEEKKDKSVFLEMKRRLKYKGALVEDELDEIPEDDDEPTEEQNQPPLTEEYGEYDPDIQVLPPTDKTPADKKEITRING